MKVSELTGTLLDYWVARAEGRRQYELRTDEDCLVIRLDNDQLGYAYCPSENWADGGPIIEREGITIQHYKGEEYPWSAILWDDSSVLPKALADVEGKTPLEAAMRCFVASKFGETVEE